MAVEADAVMRSHFDGIFSDSKYVFKVLQMPNIKGLAALTKQEIKRDIRDIERLIGDESDSDSSIKSADILNSSYPVKPRKTLKVPIPIQMDDHANGEDSDEVNDFEDLSTEDIVEFMKTVETARREVFEAERERERLEIKYQAIRDSFISHVTRFSSDKREQENYYRALQALFIRLLRVYMYYNRQNRMIFDILNALKYRRLSIDTLQVEVERLRKMKESKAVSLDTRYSEGSFVLRVTLKPSHREVLFLVGQTLHTPMGLGTIEAIFPDRGALHIKLPFGMMYTNIMAVIGWGETDAGADETLCRRWSESEKSLQMPTSVSTGIRELLGGVAENTREVCAKEESDAMEECEKGIAPAANPSLSSVLRSIPPSELPSALDSLPLVFAPPAAVPHIVDQIISSSQGLISTPTLRFCPSALADWGQQDIAVDEDWGSDVSLMRAELNKIVGEIKDLESEQARCVRLVEKSRIEGGKLLQQSTSMRLSMFTRRVRHRHNLSANNVGVLPANPLSTAPTNSINDIAASMLTLQPQTNGDCGDARTAAAPEGKGVEEPSLVKSSRVAAGNGKEDEPASKVNDRNQNGSASTEATASSNKKRGRDGDVEGTVDGAVEKKGAESAAVTNTKKKKR